MRAVPLLMLAFACQMLSAQEKLLPVLHFKHLTTADGLPSNEIRSPVVRDHLGYIWIGTVNGLARWDGNGCRVYRNDPNDSSSISSNTIMGLMEDSKHRLWIGTWESGFSLYDSDRDRFVNLRPRRNDSNWFQAKSIVQFTEDSAGNLWIGTIGGGVIHAMLPDATAEPDPDSLARAIRFRTFNWRTPRNTGRPYVDRDNGRILAATERGLRVMNTTTKSFDPIQLGGPNGRALDTLFMTALIQDRRGDIWVGGGEEGLFRIAVGTRRISNFRHEPQSPLTISSNIVRQIVEDHAGNLWIGTQEGIDLFSPATGRCTPYLSFGQAPPGSEDQRLSIDRTGAIWIATGHDGVYWLSPKASRFPNYSLAHRDGSPRSFGIIEPGGNGSYWLSSGGVLHRFDPATHEVSAAIDVLKGRRSPIGSLDIEAAVLDDRGIIWCGTWGLGLYGVNTVDGTITRFEYRPAMAGYPIVRSLARGPANSLWAATYYDGLMQFDIATGRFRRVQTVASTFTWHVMTDRHTRLWIAQERDGLILFDPRADTQRLFTHIPADPHSISHDRARGTLEDPEGRIWAAAGNVLNRWDPETGGFDRFANAALAEASLATPLGVDGTGRVWVNYAGAGLGILDPDAETFISFDVSDGVCGEIRDMENLTDGTVLLSGSSGLNLVVPETVSPRREPPPLLVQRMMINGAPVASEVLRDTATSMRLAHWQDVLEFEFAALDLDAPHRIRYSYRLEGLEDEWVEPANRRYVRYPGLPPGDFVFRVRAESAWGEWPGREIALAFSISPPWWRTWWGYALYAILAVGLVIAAYRLRLRELRLRQRAEMEHFQAKHLAEVDRLKSRFFANISHEFRTPLTLILGPLEKLRERIADESAGKDLDVIDRSARRLLRLVNQLLDLSRLEAGAMRLHAGRVNIVPLVRGIVYSFESSAGRRGIELSVQAEEEVINLHCDTEMMEKVLTNLLSNAFKFTRQGGTVSVTVAARGTDTPTAAPRSVGPAGGSGRAFPEGFAEIVVSDTGIGIPPEELPRVFDRFYQVDASQTREHEGSGIGLALVKELVDLHRGTIVVQSRVGQGTTFTVQFPLGSGHLSPEEQVEKPAGAEASRQEASRREVDPFVGREVEEPLAEDSGEEKPIVLIIEDNADVRAYMRGCLEEVYQVLSARDGMEGIAAALEAIPDLIISDVMMPGKDGYDVCKALKLDERTSHIPIILLTAKAAVEDKLDGLAVGADDYLTKPFETRELLARARNLIELRRKLRARFSATVPLKPGEIAVSSIDDVFLKKVTAAVERRMGDENFSVEDLGREVAMSRSQVHRKLKALTNQSASDFIRYMRLLRGMDLLRGNAGTVAEVAYSVGFRDPSYFSKWFHRQFGISPSDIRRDPRSGLT